MHQTSWKCLRAGTGHRYFGRVGLFAGLASTYTRPSGKFCGSRSCRRADSGLFRLEILKSHLNSPKAPHTDTSLCLTFTICCTRRWIENLRKLNFRKPREESVFRCIDHWCLIMHFPAGALIAPTVSILHLQSESGSLAPRDRCSRSKERWSSCWELHSVVHGSEGNVFCRKETLEVGSPPFLMPSSPPFFDAHVCSLRKLRAASQKLAELREHEQRWMLRATHCRTCQFWALCHCIFCMIL